MRKPHWPRVARHAESAAAPILPIMLASCVLLPAATPAHGQLTIRLTDVPAGTPAGAAIYMAGSCNGWNPAAAGYQLQKTAGGYSVTLPAAVRGPIEFKFTLGSWAAVEVDAGGNDISNRGFTVPDTGTATYRGTVAAWRDPSVPRRVRASTARPSVAVLDTAFAMPQLGRTRRVWLYLPPDYGTSAKRCPVIYMHDGQNLFDAATAYAGEWGVDETLDSLHAAGDRGAIVVGIDNGGTKRLDEYSPWRNPAHGGGEGAQYVAFIAATLKPYIDAHYRTLPDRLNTAIAGSSMGGLISLYAILKYPQVFGRAGVFSPSLWFSPEIFGLAKSVQPLRPDPRIYLVTGGLEIAPGERAGGPGDDQARMLDALTAVGFKTRTEVTASVPPDGRHAEWFWRREFPVAYLWLFANHPR